MSWKRLAKMTEKSSSFVRRCSAHSAEGWVRCVNYTPAAAPIQPNLRTARVSSACPELQAGWRCMVFNAPMAREASGNSSLWFSAHGRVCSYSSLSRFRWRRDRGGCLTARCRSRWWLDWWWRCCGRWAGQQPASGTCWSPGSAGGSWWTWHRSGCSTGTARAQSRWPR